MKEKQLEQKDKFSLKNYDVKIWLTSNYNIHIAQYVTKYRQPDYEIWSVNRL